MISRIWHDYTTKDNANACESLLQTLPMKGGLKDGTR